MKKITVFILFLLSQGITAQHRNACSDAKRRSAGSLIHAQSREASLNSLTSHELEYDVKFVHLDLHLERNTKFISGNVKTVAVVTAAAIDTFMTLLHQNHTIDSVRINGTLLPAMRQDSMIKVKLPASLATGSTFTAQVYYHGTAPVGGSAIGSGFDSDSTYYTNNTATWSLSESLVAYHWWPCKQILTDKIDSSWVFITTDSVNKAGSNGILENVVVVGNKKRYEWKSRAPIAYYLISVAVAKYQEYNQYAHPLYLPNDSILIQNYIYDDVNGNFYWTTYEKPALDKFPKVMEFECLAYGMYPFYKEKYGHCMAPFGGGMEHQTMTSLGFFDYYVDAHELGHQWFGDNVTCKSWGDIWMNEGFAAYTEHLVAEHLDSANFMPNLNMAHTDVMGQPGGSIFFTGHDTLDANRIFDGRLTYNKGGAIIRTLQFVTGDDSLWFNTLRSFQHTFKHSTASAVDFQNFYHQFTGIDPAQFFGQWYYGEGFPTFSVSFNTSGGNLILKVSEGVSMPSVTPLFITPMEYKISRFGKTDTTVRVMQTLSTEIYTLAISDSVTHVVCDPNNFVINRTHGPVRDLNLGATGIASISANNPVTIGPNPTKGMFTITNPNNLRGRISVCDLSGKQLLERSLEARTVIDLTSYPNGMYLVRITDEAGGARYSQKIIKE